MRISDWSSDVCSSDLDLCAKAAIPNDTTAEISQLVAAISEPGLVDTLGNSPALYAVMADDAAQLDRLLELGYDTSIPDGSLLHAAAFWNSVNSADRLLDKGIDPTEIGSASGRKRVSQYVQISVVAVTLKKKKKEKH